MSEPGGAGGSTFPISAEFQGWVWDLLGQARWVPPNLWRLTPSLGRGRRGWGLQGEVTGREVAGSE